MEEERKNYKRMLRAQEATLQANDRHREEMMQREVRLRAQVRPAAWLRGPGGGTEKSGGRWQVQQREQDIQGMHDQVAQSFDLVRMPVCLFCPLPPLPCLWRRVFAVWLWPARSQLVCERGGAGLAWD